MIVYGSVVVVVVFVNFTTKTLEKEGLSRRICFGRRNSQEDWDYEEDLGDGLLLLIMFVSSEHGM